MPQPQLANELTKELKALESSKEHIGDGGRSSSPIIVAKVRDLTRNVDSSEYDPNHVAIGPYNYPRPQRSPTSRAYVVQFFMCVSAAHELHFFRIFL